MNAPQEALYKRLFKATPGKILVLKPDNFEIVAVTDEYLAATMTRESDIVGKTLFDMFPDAPDDPAADGVKNLSTSLQRVLSLKTADIMGVQRYPIRLPDGTFEERFWSPVNSPVLDDAGAVEFIMHRVEDITAIVRDNENAIFARPDNQLALQDIILRAKELKHALSKLQEHEARMRTAERLLNLGSWELDPSTGSLNWSQQVFDIYDIPVSDLAPDIETYFARTHPDDREASRAIYHSFLNKHAPQIAFEHRVITRDGSVRFVKGAGQRHLTPSGEIVVGYVQDITSLTHSQQKLTQAEHLLRLAGEKARLGGWRADLSTGAVTWTPQTAAIHDMPANYSPPDVATAIEFYVPEYRQTVLDGVERCVQLGEAFDIICQLQTPQGRRPWVRAMGEAERDASGTIVAVYGAFQDISALQEAQVRANRAEQQRLDILESISDAFFALDAQWQFTYLNQQAEILLNKSRDQLLGRNVWDEYPEAVDSQIYIEYQQAVESDQTRMFQVFYQPLDKWFDITAYPIPEGLAVYFRDVTLERQRQQQLHLVETALARQNDIVMVTDAATLDEPHGPRIVYVNDAFERITGYSRKEAIGQTPRLLQGPETDRATLDLIRDALTHQRPVRSELLNYSKAGTTYWVELDITPIFDDEHNCTHFVAVERDVTDRKQQETALRQAQERFELISRATNDVIWDWHFATDEVWWNNSMTEVFGYPLTALEPGPESWSYRIHPDDQERVLASIHAVIEGDEEFWQHDYRFIKNDGEPAFVIDRGFVIRDVNGKAVRMVGSMLDITERMEMEQRLRESQKLEAVGHLTGGVAHDFNNLLTVILGNAEMLADGISDPHIRPMAQLTMSAAKRGAELTSRLLAFSRRQPLDPKPTDANQLVEAMRSLIRRTLPESIELELALDSDLGVVEIDAGELDTALLNLVVNARDAMTDGGKLTIETANVVLDADYSERHLEVTPGDYVMICVSDTGTGIPADIVNRVFEPFFTTKSIGKGSGLGLSMVFGFTKQSGGHIKIYSEPGEGTSVKLYFPRIHGVQQAIYQPIAEQLPVGGTEHILIAEDDELVQEHLQTQLQSLGYRVSAVSSGPQALKVLQQHSDIALLLTDIIMPGGMNGRELAEQAQTLYPSLKVLYTSGYTENAIVHHGRLDAGVSLLSKPYTRLELAIKVRRELQGH